MGTRDPNWLRVSRARENPFLVQVWGEGEQAGLSLVNLAVDKG